MPRINRTTVQFKAGGKLYTASFKHQHDETGKLPIPDANRSALAQHITTCELTREDFVGGRCTGRAYCSSKDTYDWRRGIKTALVRALLAAGIQKPIYSEALGSFYRELHNRGKMLGPGSGSPAHTVDVIEGSVMDPQRLLAAPTGQALIPDGTGGWLA